MNDTFGTSKGASDKLVERIKHKTRKHSSTEEKIRIVQAGLRHHVSIGCGGGFRPVGGA
jgi:transposase